MSIISNSQAALRAASILNSLAKLGIVENLNITAFDEEGRLLCVNGNRLVTVAKELDAFLACDNYAQHNLTQTQWKGLLYDLQNYRKGFKLADQYDPRTYKAEFRMKGKYKVELSSLVYVYQEEGNETKTLAFTISEFIQFVYNNTKENKDA